MIRKILTLVLAANFLVSCSANYQAYTTEKLALIQLKLAGKISPSTYQYRLAALERKYYGGGGSYRSSSSSKSKKSNSGSQTKPAGASEPSVLPSSGGGGSSSPSANPYAPQRPSTGDPDMGTKPRRQPSVSDAMKNI
jgi:hypothetical protein